MPGPAARRRTVSDVRAAPGGRPGPTAGERLPDPLRARLERAFGGADLSDVRVHHGPQADAADALAYTHGSDIHFGRGEYQPDTAYGRALLGHEVAHVVQQRAGRVTGTGVDPDARLESEAHETGLRVARGAVVHLPGAGRTGRDGTPAGAPVQRTPKPLKKFLRRLGVMRPAAPAAPAAPPPPAPLDEFVDAYESARFYHATRNAASVQEHGLLNYRDRQEILGRQVGGMSIGKEYAGDEKKGVFLGGRAFNEENEVTLPPDRVRLYLNRGQTTVHHWDDPDSVPPDELMRDEKFRGGGMIMKNSILPPYTQFGSLNDMLDAAADGDAAAGRRVAAMHEAVSSHYAGDAPALEEMVNLLRQAIVQRRLSDVALRR
jgi:hypothetical protein